jgi:WD40 repeat protein
MKFQDILKCLVPAIFSLVVTTLEHEKSFLMQNGAARATQINFYKDSLLITSSNDIVQKDIETGVFQRTFRAHSSQILTFFVTNDSRMITSSYDDSVIVWDLVSGSVRKRIPLKSSNTIIYCMFYMDEQVFTGGYDGKLRKIDLVTAKVVKIIGKRLMSHKSFL